MSRDRIGVALLVVLTASGLGGGATRGQSPRAAEPTAPPGTFLVPGYYEPTDGRTVRTDDDPTKADGLTWRGPFRAKSQPGWTWHPAGWSQTAGGWVFRPGAWKRAVPTREQTAVMTRLLAAQAGNGASMNHAPAAGGTAAPAAIGPTPTPGTAFYIGNSAPGMTYNSVAPQLSGSPGHSVYIGASAPGMSYPSVSATQPPGGSGQTFYIGHSAPGMSYATVSPAGTSVGGYGYGTSPPGTNTGGQVGAATPP